MKSDWQKGFSILEVLIAISILAFILAGLYNLFNSQVRSFEAQRDVSTTQRDIRAALSMIERDVRMAGFGVPRGTNPMAAVQDGTFGNPADPDSISLNVSTGSITYLENSTVGLPGVENNIEVDSVTGFAVGDTVNLINHNNNNLIGTYVIDAIDTGNNTLSLSDDPTLSGIEIGDYVIRNFNTITYAVITNGVTGRNELVRSNGLFQSTIIDGVADFQLTYILDDGSETASPGDLSDIRRVRIDITAETVKEAARLGSQQIPRELVTIVPIKNVRL